MPGKSDFDVLTLRYWVYGEGKLRDTDGGLLAIGEQIYRFDSFLHLGIALIHATSVTTATESYC
jgi:hypothetical protein